jgi:hypothetical protein
MCRGGVISFVVDSVGTMALSEGGGLKRDARDLSGWMFLWRLLFLGGRCFMSGYSNHMDDGNLDFAERLRSHVCRIE